jgi:hypothetical protein
VPELEIAECLAHWWSYFLYRAFSKSGVKPMPFAAYDPEGFAAFNALSTDRRSLCFRTAQTLLEIR